MLWLTIACENGVKGNNFYGSQAAEAGREKVKWSPCEQFMKAENDNVAEWTISQLAIKKCVKPIKSNAPIAAE